MQSTNLAHRSSQHPLECGSLKRQRPYQKATRVDVQAHGLLVDGWTRGIGKAIVRSARASRYIASKYTMRSNLSSLEPVLTLITCGLSHLDLCQRLQRLTTSHFVLQSASSHVATLVTHAAQPVVQSQLSIEPIDADSRHLSRPSLPAISFPNHSIFRTLVLGKLCMH